MLSCFAVGALLEGRDRDQSGHEHGDHADQEPELGGTGALATWREHDQDEADHRDQSHHDERLSDEAMRAER